MSTILLDTLLLFFLEIIEANLQKGSTFSQLVNNLHQIKKQSFIKFLAIHLSLIYVVYYYIAAQNNYLLIIIAIKVLDLIVKLNLIGSIEKNNRPFSTQEHFGMSDIAVSAKLRYFGAMFYTLLFFLAIS